MFNDVLWPTRMMLVSWQYVQCTVVLAGMLATGLGCVGVYIHMVVEGAVLQPYQCMVQGMLAGPARRP